MDRERPKQERQEVALSGKLCKRQVTDMVINLPNERMKFPPRCELAVAKLTKIPGLPMWKLRFQKSVLSRRTQLSLIAAFIFVVIILGSIAAVVVYMAVTGNLRFWQVDSNQPAKETLERTQSQKSAVQSQIWTEEKIDASNVTWSSWSEWSPCSPYDNCNSNQTQNRSRECIERHRGESRPVAFCKFRGRQQIETRTCVCTTVSQIDVWPENTTTETIITNSTKKQNYGCSNCQENEICMLHQSDDEPYCTPLKDSHDHSGCGGWCSSAHEICNHLDNITVQCVDDTECLKGEWQCRDDRLCIPNDRRCDGHFNCFDMSDEINCACKPGEFHCGNDTSCLPHWQRCNGYTDCWDGSDEADCNQECLGSKYTCTSGQCISPAYFCDGYYDCDDHSDEPIGCEGVCQKAHLKCYNGRCIQDIMRCNLVNDCGDNSDEMNCER